MSENMRVLLQFLINAIVFGVFVVVPVEFSREVAAAICIASMGGAFAWSVFLILQRIFPWLK